MEEFLLNNSEFLFTTSWGRATWAITIIALLISLAAIGFLLIFGALQLNAPNNIGTIFISLAVFEIISLALVAIFAPGHYLLNSSGIKIKRVVGCIDIPVDSITSVEMMDESMSKGSIRLMASGGFFGFFGRFRSPALGAYSVYATRGENLVLIRRKDAIPIVLSPDDPEGFIEAVNSLLPDSAGSK